MSENTDKNTLVDLTLENKVLRKVLEATRVKLASTYISLIDVETLLEIEKEKTTELLELLDSRSENSK